MVVIAMILSLCIGGATMKGTTPEKEVVIMLADCQAAFKAGDLEKIMDCYSNDFTDTQGANKDMVRSSFEGMVAQGTLQSITILDLEEGAITVNGDTATVTPLVINSPIGEITYHCTLKKETDGVWRFGSSETKGIKESALLSPDNSVIEEKVPFPGYLFRPKDNAAHPGIIFLHGSEGGNGDYNDPFGQIPRTSTGKNAATPSFAREYASRGYVTYALCYYDCKCHEGNDTCPPDNFKEIDIYKITYEAFIWLKKSDYVQNKKVAIWGGSIGAEHSLLFASLIGKHKESMKLIEPDAILAFSPPDIATGNSTKKQLNDLYKGIDFVRDNYSAWMFANKKIKTGTPIDIQNYNGPVLITYFTNDPIIWGAPINPENLVKKYSDNNIPHTFIHFCDENDMSKTFKEVKDNIDKNIIINFTKEKGHVSPREQKSASLMYESIELFLKTHLGD